MRKNKIGVHKAASSYGYAAPCVGSHFVTCQKSIKDHSQYSNNHHCYQNEASP
ncbi:MAG: hypothetical protein ACI3ZJ_10015 [Bacteroidaceae bacterium]